MDALIWLGRCCCCCCCCCCCHCCHGLQVTSSCACERNWSTYDYIHNRKRNKLSPSRARDLVYVFTNERLLRQMNKADREEAFLPWDDPSDSEKGEGEEEEEAAEEEEEEVL